MLRLTGYIQCPYVQIVFQYRGMYFAWEAEKAAANVAKHDLSFEKACEVFLDPLLQLWEASVEGEFRLAVVGATLDRDLLYVVHVEREDERAIRIISARYATRSERERYEDNG